jgi:hypothetical protein
MKATSVPACKKSATKIRKPNNTRGRANLRQVLECGSPMPLYGIWRRERANKLPTCRSTARRQSSEDVQKSSDTIGQLEGGFAFLLTRYHLRFVRFVLSALRRSRGATAADKRHRQQKNHYAARAELFR